LEWGTSVTSEVLTSAGGITSSKIYTNWGETGTSQPMGKYIDVTAVLLITI